MNVETASRWGMLGLLPACAFHGIAAPAPRTPASQSACPDASPLKPANETYRLRVANKLYGGVEISTDGGYHYLLIGRVLHPASAFVTDHSAAAGGRILRASGLGIAFSIGRDRALKLRPFQPITLLRKPGAKRAGLPAVKFPAAEPSAIVTNVEPEQGIFADLLPPEHTPVAVEIDSREPIVFPDEYVPSQDDAYVFSVHLEPPVVKNVTAPIDANARAAAWNADLDRRVHELAATYAAGAVGRARAEKRTVVAGNLTLRATLPPDEPEPIEAVTYLVDGDVIAAQNVAPYSYTWDTHHTTDGEHVVEIKAVDRNANPITSVRTLIVVVNGSPTSAEH